MARLVIKRAIEIANEDAPNMMTWTEAQKYAKSLGEGWRLPSREELNEMCNNKELIGGFASGYYWSSSEDGGCYLTWTQHFGKCYQSYDGKANFLRVRVVRDTEVLR